ncbi:MAG: hypothetical protein NT069_25355 [Planctomycetota bacterium]|nr:hypothetical protein [Planctomycetota bacterium]
MATSNRLGFGRRQEIGGRAQQMFDHFRDDATDYAEQGRDKLQRAGRSISHFVREEPLEAALIGASITMAVGVAVVLSRLWIRRISR